MTNINNKMQAQFELIGYRESNQDVSIEIRALDESNINVDLLPRIFRESSINSEINVVYSDSSSINVEILATMYNSIPVTIEVKPHNRMSVRYELTEPPSFSIVNNSIQDTFVTQNPPYNYVNYGTNNSMKVGFDNRGENISYIKFDVSNITIGSVVRKATLRVYYSQLNSTQLETYQVNTSWEETSITYSNQPVDSTLISSTFTDNTIDKYIDIDVTESVAQWVNGYFNNGFAIKSLDGLSVFRTKEYGLPAELIISYIPIEPINVGLSKQSVDLLVRTETESSINIELDVISDFGFSYLPVTIFTKQANEIFNNDIDVELDVNVNMISDISDIHVEISVADTLSEKINIELEVPEYQSESVISTDIEVKGIENSIIPIELNIPQYQNNSNINTEITVQQFNTSTINTEIEIPVYTNLFAVSVEITVRQIDNSSVNVGIEVPQYNQSDNINVKIGIPFKDSITVGAEINVPEYQDGNVVNVELMIYAKRNEYIPVELEVNQYQLDSIVTTEIEVPTYNSDNSINIEIGVWEHINSNIDVELLPRLESISYISVNMRTNSAFGSAYVFIM